MLGSVASGTTPGASGDALAMTTTLWPDENTLNDPGANGVMM